MRAWTGEGWQVSVANGKCGGSDSTVFSHTGHFTLKVEAVWTTGVTTQKTLT